MIEKYSYVYCITNVINGKKYIGSRSTKNHEVDDYLGSGKLIKQALAKYGTKSFVKDILWIGPIEYRFDMEEYWIDYFNASENDLFYNIQKIPQKAFAGMKQSEETKKRISKALAGLKKKSSKNYKGPITDEHRLNIMIAMTGQKYPPERCKNISEGLKGLPSKHKGTIVKCPYCPKLGNLYPMKQWHFSHCKFKTISDILVSLQTTRIV